MNFCEFRIQLRQGSVVATFNGDLKVPNVPRGPATTPMELRLTGIRKQAIQVLGHLVEKDRAEREELKLLGCFLYDLLFQGEVRSRFEKVYDAVKRADDHVLRVVLDFKDRDLFSELPWEYLYIPDYDGRPRGVFLAAVSTMVLSRHVQLGFEPTQAAEEIRILGVVSDPANIKEKVVADAVIDKLEDLGRKVAGEPADGGEAHGDPAGDKERRVRFDVLRQPTRKTFREMVRAYRPHVLHFAGHGKCEGEEGFIGLCLEGSDRVDWLSGSDLTDLLGERRRLHLVVLQACEGAANTGFDGVARQLVTAAVPAVIAMRYEIDNEAALKFCTTFYEALADGWPVDSAVQRGREAIAQMGREGYYRDRRFGTPVVFLRSEDYLADHRIIEPPAGQAKDDAGPPAPVAYLPCPFCGEKVNAAGSWCPNSGCGQPFHVCPDCGENAIPKAVDLCEACAEKRTPRAAVQGHDLEALALGRTGDGSLAGEARDDADPAEAGPSGRPYEVRKRVTSDG